MTGNRALLMNFVEKFLGTVRFGNNNFAVIAGYGDVVIGSMTIKKVYYVKDLLTGNHSSNLYTISLNEIASTSSNRLLAKASSLQSWLWHQRLSHLNFATINNLVKNNLVRGLPNMKFEKHHLCSACEQEKIYRKHNKSKTAFSLNKPLYLLHMDLCAPMRVKSINEKRYVLVFVDDYSLYTWVIFLHSKDEASELDTIDKKALIMMRRLLQLLELRLYAFFAYAAHMDFTVFQMDVKTALLNGILKEQVYVAQPLGFVSKQYPDHVYALEKALYGLK
nr:hypothetical protein [Tanacetum cinerariifolium]